MMMHRFFSYKGPSMLTFKQMEALYWIVQLGSFEAAASRLNATQSAVSKRVQELERLFEITVFDRAHRSARLTEKGAEIFRLMLDTASGRKTRSEIHGYGQNEWLAWTPFSYPFNLTGQPAITVPCGFSKDGLPIGLQISGANWTGEVNAIALAYAYQQATEWHKRPLTLTPDAKVPALSQRAQEQTGIYLAR